MLRNLIQQWLQPEKSPAAANVEEPPPLSITELGELISNFPIGGKVGYFPEYRRDKKLETVIIAYLINGRLVYSTNDLVIEENSEPALRLNVPNSNVLISRVSEFAFVVPLTRRGEVDYVPGPSDTEEAQYKDVNDFAAGNTITLFNRISGNRVPTLDTVVRRPTIIKSGVFSNQQAVMLDPMVETFSLVDRRNSERVATSLPARAAMIKDAPPEECVVEEFSGRFLKVRLADDSEERTFEKGHRVVMDLRLDEMQKRFVLKGQVFRMVGGAVVVSIVGIYKDDRFVEFEVIDEMDLTASLLNHSGTIASRKG